jgi:hypothetical protein
VSLANAACGLRITGGNLCKILWKLMLVTPI